MGFKIDGLDEIQKFLDDYKKVLSVKLLMSGQTVLHKLQRNCAMTLIVSVSNGCSSSRMILKILALTWNLPTRMR